MSSDAFRPEDKEVIGYLEQVKDHAIAFAIGKATDQPEVPSSLPDQVTISKYSETEDKLFYRLVCTQAGEDIDGLRAVLHAILNLMQPQDGPSSATAQAAVREFLAKHGDGKKS